MARSTVEVSDTTGFLCLEERPIRTPSRTGKCVRYQMLCELTRVILKLIRWDDSGSGLMLVSSKYS